MSTVFVVKKVQDQLHRAEAAIDAAMRENAVLLTRILEAKTELGMASPVAARETAKLTAVIENLGGDHKALAEIHAGLQAVARRNGIEPKASGAWKDDMALNPEDQTVLRQAV